MSAHGVLLAPSIAADEHLCSLRDCSPEVLDVLCGLEHSVSSDVLDARDTLLAGSSIEVEQLLDGRADETATHVFADTACWDAWDGWQFSIAASNELLAYADEIVGCSWCGDPECGHDCD